MADQTTLEDEGVDIRQSQAEWLAAQIDLIDEWLTELHTKSGSQLEKRHQLMAHKDWLVSELNALTAER